MSMMLQDKLNKIATQLRQALDPAELEQLDRAIDRLRMLQIVEQGLTVGDVLPDFALPDSDGRIVTSEGLLAHGPLALAFFRGPWCPYCSLALQALEEARPKIEHLGASLVAVAPVPAEELRRVAQERGLGLRLLSDLGTAYAKVCGVQFEMTDDFTALYRRLARRFGLEIPPLRPGSVWQLPIPATYVAGQDGVIRYAFADADWAQRADPADVAATVEQLAQAAEATG
jgi:peroxiredoxin